MDQNVKVALMWFLSIFYSILILLKILFTMISGAISVFKVKNRTPPPILNDERWGTHRFITLKQNQNIKLHYVEKGEDSSKPLLVCLHGFPQCWFSWRNQIQEFSSYFRMIAVDMRGYGDSDKPKDTDDYIPEKIADDIYELIMTINGDKGKCNLMAHDWGGAIAWILIGKYPHLFERHICINGPNLAIMEELILSKPGQFFSSWYIFLFQMRWLPEILFRLKDLEVFDMIFQELKDSGDPIADEVIAVYKYYFSQKGALTPPLNYYRNVFYFDFKKFLNKNKIPTLIIWGEDDKSLSTENAIRCLQFCENGEYKMIKGGGHNLHESHKKEVNEYIWNFIQPHK